MKHYITENDWTTLEELLMKAEIPYNVSWDSHGYEGDDDVTYNKYIRIEPIVIQRVRKVK
jgi:hypothetical protein